MSFRKLLGMVALLGLTVSASAQTYPGITRPIHVGIFKGIGAGQYWHTSIHTAGTTIRSILSNPASATNNLGPNLIVPPAGFTFQQFGDDSTQSNVAPTAAEVTAFISALDTLDVVVIHAAVGVMSAISNATQRQRLADFWSTHGLITLHASTDTKNFWAPWDTIQGAQFSQHPQNDQPGKLYRDTLDTSMTGSPYYQTLNASLKDTTFTEEWFFFTTSSATIRAKSNLHVLIDIDESSLKNGITPATAMGKDHPMSWYRPLPTGGRFFYSAVGHESQNFTTVQNRFLRRQIYNAVLWSAKYDTTLSGGGGVAIRNTKTSGSPSDYAKLSISGSSLTVSPIQFGLHTVELLTLDGKQITSQTGMNQTSHTFSNLHNGLYVLSISTPAGRSTQLVTIQ